MNAIERMQTNLLLIRLAVGWSAEEFGDRIGVTRQTINNLESGRSKLSKTQYIAMRSVLDAEIASAPQETEMLKLLLDALVDNPEAYTDEEVSELLGKAKLIAPSILAGTSTRENASKQWLAVVGAAGAAATALLSSRVAGIGVAAASGWLAKVLESASKKK